MEEAGASAIVLTSLFEEQLALESRALDEDLSRGTESFAESLDFLPDLGDYRMTHEVYLEYLRRSKEAVNIPIMASLNGATTGGWVRFAREMEEAGADAIELNTYALATDRSQTSTDLELQLLELVDARLPRGQDSGGRQAFAVVHQPSAPGGTAGRCGRARRGALQPLLSARLRHRDAGGAAHAALLHAVGVAAPAALGGDSLRPHQHRHRHHRRRALGRGRAEVASWPAAAWP